jgi:hypothetical protein
MASPYWIVQYLPRGLFETIGVVHPFTFLAGPLAILALVAWRRTSPAAGRERMLPAALCLGLLSVTVPMVTGTVLLVQVFATIGATGAGGGRMVADALINASHPMFYGLLTVALCGAVAAWLVLRSGATAPTTHRIRWGAAAGVVAVLGLIALDVLLRQHHALTDTLITLIDPSRSGNLAAATSALDRANGLLLYGGALLTFILLAAAGAIARRTEAYGLALTSAAPRIGRTFAAAAIALALVASLWHATQLWASLEDYRAIAGQGTSANSNTVPARDAQALRR